MKQILTSFSRAIKLIFPNILLGFAIFHGLIFSSDALSEFNPTNKAIFEVKSLNSKKSSGCGTSHILLSNEVYFHVTALHCFVEVKNRTQTQVLVRNRSEKTWELASVLKFDSTKDLLSLSLPKWFDPNIRDAIDLDNAIGLENYPRAFPLYGLGYIDSSFHRSESGEVFGIFDQAVTPIIWRAVEPLSLDGLFHLFGLAVRPGMSGGPTILFANPQIIMPDPSGLISKLNGKYLGMIKETIAFDEESFVIPAWVIRDFLAPNQALNFGQSLVLESDNLRTRKEPLINFIEATPVARYARTLTGGGNSHAESGDLHTDPFKLFQSQHAGAWLLAPLIEPDEGVIIKPLLDTNQYKLNSIRNKFVDSSGVYGLPLSHKILLALTFKNTTYQIDGQDNLKMALAILKIDPSNCPALFPLNSSRQILSTNIACLNRAGKPVRLITRPNCLGDTALEKSDCWLPDREDLIERLQGDYNTLLPSQQIIPIVSEVSHEYSAEYLLPPMSLDHFIFQKYKNKFGYITKYRGKANFYLTIESPLTALLPGSVKVAVAGHFVNSKKDQFQRIPRDVTSANYSNYEKYEFVISQTASWNLILLRDGKNNLNLKCPNINYLKMICHQEESFIQSSRFSEFILSISLENPRKRIVKIRLSYQLKDSPEEIHHFSGRAVKSSEKNSVFGIF